MASPITWRNVASTTSSGGVGALLESARRSADSGFAAIGSALDDARQIQKEGRELETKDNTREFRRMLSGFDSAEDFQAARDSGQLDQMLDGYGRRVDDSVIGEMFGQGDKYRARDTNRNTFSDDQTLRGQRDTEAAIARDIALGNTDSALERAGTLEIGAGKHYEAIRDDQRERTTDANNAERLRLAQVASSRQGQAHQLRMQEAQRLEEERQRSRTADAMTMDYFSTVQQQRTAYEAGTASVLQDLGLSGDFANLEDEDKARVTAEMTRRNLVAPPTDTEMVQTVTNQLANNPEMTPATMVSVTSNLDKLLNGSNAISSSDQAKLEARKASVAASIAEVESTNPYFTTAPASEQANEISELIESKGDDWTFFGYNKEDLQKVTTEWMTKGYDTTINVEDADGNTRKEKVTIKLSAPALKEALTLTDADDDFFVKEDVEAWIEQNKSKLLEANLAVSGARDGMETVRRLEQDLRSRKYGDVELTDDTMNSIRNYGK